MLSVWCPQGGLTGFFPSNIGGERDQICTKQGPLMNCVRQVKQLLRRKVKRFRGGLVLKTPRLLYHSTRLESSVDERRQVDLSQGVAFPYYCRVLGGGGFL
jgi:hypothetical protein